MHKKDVESELTTARCLEPAWVKEFGPRYGSVLEAAAFELVRRRYRARASWDAVRSAEPLRREYPFEPAELADLAEQLLAARVTNGASANTD